MRVIESAAELAHIGPCAFVPTMGALHEGHLELIRRARTLAESSAPKLRVVVSIFVNPTQFNDPGDLARYPRTLERDLQGCASAGADAVFVPAVGEVYPRDAPVPVPPLPPVATEPRLEDARRPGHFAGVCQVVSRLFDLVRPDVALFGEKDWQQLRVISAMTEAQQRHILILGVPTVREPDGLAMSSRNVFLSPAQREQAASIPRALRAATACATIAQAEATMQQMLTAAGMEIEYATVRDALTLMPKPPDAPLTGCRALVAVRSAVRLLDNHPAGGNAAT